MWLTEKLTDIFTSKYLLSFVRTILAYVAGFLTVVPSLDPKDIAQFLSSGEHILYGLLLYLIAQIWSWADKKQNQT